MFSVAKYRESVIKESRTLVIDDYSVESDVVINSITDTTEIYTEKTKK